MDPFSAAGRLAALPAFLRASTSAIVRDGTAGTSIMEHNWASATPCGVSAGAGRTAKDTASRHAGHDMPGMDMN